MLTLEKLKKITGNQSTKDLVNRLEKKFPKKKIRVWTKEMMGKEVVLKIQSF